MMMSSLMIPIRSYPLRMSSPFQSSQGMISTDLMKVTFFEVTAFRGIYYHKSGDVRPGYTCASPFDHQGHMALKLNSGTASYSLYIGLVSTGIVYPRQEDPDIQIDQYSYFDITGSVPPIANHGI